MYNKETVITKFLDINNVSFKNQIRTPLFFYGLFTLLCGLMFFYYKAYFIMSFFVSLFLVFFIWCFFVKKRFNLKVAFLYEGLTLFCTATILFTTTLIGLSKTHFGKMPYIIVTIIGSLISIIFLLYRHWYYRIGLYKSNNEFNPIYTLITVPIMLAIYPVFKKYTDQLDNDFVITMGTLILGYIWLWIGIIALHKCYIFAKHCRETNQPLKRNAEDV